MSVIETSKIGEKNRNQPNLMSIFWRNYLSRLSIKYSMNSLIIINTFYLTPEDKVKDLSPQVRKVLGRNPLLKCLKDSFLRNEISDPRSTQCSVLWPAMEAPSVELKLFRSKNPSFYMDCSEPVLFLMKVTIS